MKELYHVQESQAQKNAPTYFIEIPIHIEEVTRGVYIRWMTMYHKEHFMICTLMVGITIDVLSP